ncbi:hypothetical protein ACEPAF_8848 [Sanghuangporus sanghuang]
MDSATSSTPPHPYGYKSFPHAVDMIEDLGYDHRVVRAPRMPPLNPEEDHGFLGYLLCAFNRAKALSSSVVGSRLTLSEIFNSSRVTLLKALIGLAETLKNREAVQVIILAFDATEVEDPRSVAWYAPGVAPARLACLLEQFSRSTGEAAQPHREIYNPSPVVDSRRSDQRLSLQLQTEPPPSYTAMASIASDVRNGLPVLPLRQRNRESQALSTASAVQLIPLTHDHEVNWPDERPEQVISVRRTSSFLLDESDRLEQSAPRMENGGESLGLWNFLRSFFAPLVQSWTGPCATPPNM